MFDPIVFWRKIDKEQLRRFKEREKIVSCKDSSHFYGRSE